MVYVIYLIVALGFIMFPIAVVALFLLIVCYCVKKDTHKKIVKGIFFVALAAYLLFVLYFVRF